MSENRGIVIATEYFPYKEGQIDLLGEVLRDDNTREHVTGLWVPHSLLSNHDRMTHLTSLSHGNGISDYKTSLNKSSESSQKKTFRMIIDTALAGGVHDMVQYASDILQNFPGSHTTFTISPLAMKQGIDGILAEFRGQDNIDFLMSGVYPEHTPDSIQKFTGMTENDYTSHVSKMTDEFELAGVVGVAELANRTIPGQYYLAMGVTQDGLDYESSINVRSSRHNDEPRYVIKRASTPEQALAGATNTELLLGRALVYGTGKSEISANEAAWRPEANTEIISIVRENIFGMSTRARAA